MSDEIKLSDGTTLSQHDFDKLAQIFKRNATQVRNRRSDKKPDTIEGDNAKFILDALEVYKLPDIDKHDPVAVQDRVMEYFEICARQDKKPNVPGLALALGWDRTTLGRVVYGRDGFDKTYSAEIRSILKKAYDLMNAQMEDWMQTGKVNPVVGIFLSKNHWGYQDKTDLVVSPAGAEESYNADDIRKRYIKAADTVEIPDTDLRD